MDNSDESKASVTKYNEDSTLISSRWEVANMSEGEIKKEKRKIRKNIYLISFAFFCNYTSHTGLARLQSSLHIDEGMGVINQSIVFTFLVLSSFFVPTLLIKLIGHKWSMTISFIGYILWMLANGYAVWATMIPASILLGICGAPLLASQSAYFNIMCNRYTILTGEDHHVVVSRFFGIFFCIYQLAGISGSIISSAILRPENDTTADDPTEAQLEFCGIKDCPSSNVSNPHLQEIDDDTLWELVLVYVGIACLAVVITAVFVDNLPDHVLVEKSPDDKPTTEESKCDLLLKNLKLLKHRKLQLMIPLTVYSSLEMTFFDAEYSKSFVSCSVGIWLVGLVTIPFGLVNGVSSILNSWVVHNLGRIPVIIFAAMVDISIQVTLMNWMPDPGQMHILFILSGAWGITDSIWQTQISSLFGILFSSDSEAAFSNYWMLKSSGFIIAFAYSGFLCTSVKLYILPCMLCLGITCYLVVEYKKIRGQKNVNYDHESFNSKMSTQKVDYCDNDGFSTHL